MAYTEQFRAEALVTLEANGGNILQTAEQLSIGQATLSKWVAENRDIKETSSDLAVATAELVPETRESFISELKTIFCISSLRRSKDFFLSFIKGSCFKISFRLVK